jgi:hypothetical protein
MRWHSPHSPSKRSTGAAAIGELASSIGPSFAQCCSDRKSKTGRPRGPPGVNLHPNSGNYLISICRGLSASAFGSVTVRTPFS